jgi:hypothetical protein
MQIICKKVGSEAERKRKESFREILRAYYNREIRDGSRFRSKVPGGKDVIKRIYEE